MTRHLEPITFDPTVVLLIGIILVTAMLVLAIIIVVGLIDRRDIRIDPHEAAHGDVPGFTREQLEQFQATRREPRGHADRVRT